MATPLTRPPRVEIEYCTQCRWLLRAAWMAQELLSTFEAEIGEVAPRPRQGRSAPVPAVFIRAPESESPPPEPPPAPRPKAPGTLLGADDQELAEHTQ